MCDFGSRRESGWNGNNDRKLARGRGSGWDTEYTGVVCSVWEMAYTHTNRRCGMRTWMLLAAESREVVYELTEIDGDGGKTGICEDVTRLSEERADWGRGETL